MNGHGLTAGAALVGGVISFLSPCVLPLAPGYVSMLWGITLEQLRSDADHGPLRKMVLLNGIASVTGAATRDDDDRGRPAPNLQLVDLEGRSVSLASLRGKVVIVDFWATWCPPCVMEVPTFKKLQTTYRDKGLEIIAISLDEDKRDLAEFIRKNDLTYTVVLGDENLAEKFGPLTGLPMTYFIDRKGRIRIEHAGFMDYENFAHEVERLLAEPR